jgi:transposase InsO family protein
MALAYPQMSGSPMYEEMGKAYFISALEDPVLKLKIEEREPKDLDAAYRLAERLEVYLSKYQKAEQSSHSGSRRPSPEVRQRRDRGDERPSKRVAAVGQNVEQTGSEARLKSLEKQLSEVSKEVGRYKLLEERRQAQNTQACQQPTGGQSPNADLLQVITGAIAQTLLSQRSAPQLGTSSTGKSSPGLQTQQKMSSLPATSSADSISPLRQQRSNNPVRCYNCDELGHISRNCVHPRRARQQGGAPSGSAEAGDKLGTSTIGAVRGTAGKRIPGPVPTYLKLNILEGQTDCLVDTGSDVTIFPASVVRGVEVKPTSQKLVAANGTSIAILGTAIVMAIGNNHEFRLEGFVSNHISDVILGSDFLKNHHAEVNFAKDEVKLNGHVLKLHRKPRVPWCRRIVLAETVTVPARCEAIVPAYVVYDKLITIKSDDEVIWVTEPNQLNDGLCVSSVAIPDRDDNIPIRVLNAMEAPSTVEAGITLATLEPASIGQPTTESGEVNDAMAQIIDDMISRVDNEVSNDYRADIKRMLWKYSAAFSVSETDLGRTDIIKHTIDTGDARPVRQPLRRHPPAYQEAIKEHVTTLLSQGVIEPASSPWASNIVLVRKKDGSLRTCIDYRQLNYLTRKDAYPLPRTDMCLDAMSGARWFSTFDLRSAYHQVELDDRDKDKTAFICREGMYRYHTMPNGLCNAGATFQRLMDLIMTGLTFDILLVYLDDIILFSTTLSEHLERLTVVLERLIKAGLKLKPSKVHLFQRSVEFLGHLVSENGVAPHPGKISDVVNWPVPTCVKDVRAFVGLAGYYRRFVSGFSTIAASLYDLMCKGHKFVWNEACQESFDELKRRLVTAPILGMPSNEGRFILDTDASDSAVGAVLSQEQDGVERVIAYASKSLSREQRNYCVTRRELLAIVTFLKYFRHYILGRRFLVRTDHAALQWLRRIPEPIGQQARWITFMEEFQFDIVHRAGKSHGNADALSRRPCDRPRCCKQYEPDAADGVHRCLAVLMQQDSLNDQMVETEEVVSWTAEAMAKDQTDDPDIGPIMKRKVAELPRPAWDDVAALSETSKSLWRQWDRLRMFRGYLVREFEKPDGGIQSLQAVMPKCRREVYIEALHTGMTGGHLGQRRTKRALQLRAYWPGWSRDVDSVLRKCTPCAQYRRGLAPKQTPLKPFLAGEVLETVSIDITGPHPRSRRGNEYMVTLVDHFSKWAEAIPLRNHTAQTVAWALFSNVFVRFGMPLRILTDQGPEFEGQLFSELCRLMDIHKLRTTPYKPSTNAVVERVHKTINSMLAKCIRSDQRDWCEHVPTVMAAYRASCHESTGQSPNRLMFGRESRLPVDLVVPTTPENEERRQSADDYVDRLYEKSYDDFKLVRQHLSKAAERRKSRYDDAVREKQFEVGQWVWYYYPRRKKGLSPKWQNWYVGPYLIVRFIDTHNVVIQRTKKAKPIVVHRDKIKLCLNPAACPKLWTTRPEKDQDLSDDENQMPNPEGSLPKEKQDRRDTPVANPVQNEVTNRGEDDALGLDVSQENVSPKRNAKPPAKLRDFVANCPAYVQRAG